MIFTNLKDLRAYVWDTRPHKSEISDEMLVNEFHPQWHWQFMHILSKGAFPKWKYESDNFILGTINEHTQQTAGWDNKELQSKFEEIAEKKKQEYYKIKR